jgi:GWxTD domain-containing protein
MLSIFTVKTPNRILIALVLILPIAAFCQSDKHETPASARSNSLNSSNTAYQRWLAEDARWIITPEEEVEFSRLSSNADRDVFIVQFWLRRDPSPSTDENEFKEEHYRRIAYSNEHFGSATKGSLTDRGRIYIMYGVPDAIRVQPQTVDSARTQVWHYRAVAGLGKDLDFTFLDQCECNDYRLQTHEPR